MTSAIFHNLPFTDEELGHVEANQALGQFMAAYAQVEGVFAFIFSSLNPGETSWIDKFYGFKTNENQIKKLRKLLAPLTDDNLPAETIGELDEAVTVWDENLRKQRNYLVHGFWGMIGGVPARIYQTSDMSQLMTDEGIKLARERQELFLVEDIDALTNLCRHLRDRSTVIDRKLSQIHRIPGVSRHLVEAFIQSVHHPEARTDAEIQAAYGEIKSIIHSVMLPEIDIFTNRPNYIPGADNTDWHAHRRLLENQNENKSYSEQQAIVAHVPRLIELYQITRPRRHHDILDHAFFRSDIGNILRALQSYIRRWDSDILAEEALGRI